MSSIKSAIKNAVIIFVLVLTALMTGTTKAEMIGIIDEHFYTETYFIYAMDEELDEFYIREFGDGKAWTVEGIEDWFVGDIISVTFTDNGTKTVSDDEIRAMKYIGYIFDDSFELEKWNKE